MKTGKRLRVRLGVRVRIFGNQEDGCAGVIFQELKLTSNPESEFPTSKI